MTRIALAETDADIQRCHAIMRELRPHVVEDEFLSRLRRQAREHGYRLAFLEDGGDLKAVAGFRITEMLAWGRALYVDDLVTLSTERSKGYGERLFDWLVGFARTQNCEQLHLDSGVQRFGAHRFYLRRRMDITAHHFAMKLQPP